MQNYHLTEVGTAVSVGPTDLPPGFYPADEDGRSNAFDVAPGEYVEEFGRRRLDFADPSSDECVRAAIEAHRRGDPLPPEPEPGAQRWQPPSPTTAPAFEIARRRTTRPRSVGEQQRRAEVQLAAELTRIGDSIYRPDGRLLASWLTHDTHLHEGPHWFCGNTTPAAVRQHVAELPHDLDVPALSDWLQRRWFGRGSGDTWTPR